MIFDEELDTTGLMCPQVLLKAKQTLENMGAGQILKVISTDPSSVLDIKVFAATKSYQLLDIISQQQKFIFWIKK
jgi:tRNA 2-thiouridine synthesizing protein A